MNFFCLGYSMDKYIVNFGKYKGLTFEELVNVDEKYCKWILKLDEFNNEKLKTYIKEKLKL